MSVRKTESRLPAGSSAGDLGEAVTAPDGKSALVSFITSPVVVGRENTYVVFVTDSALASSVHSYEWTFTENGGTPAVHASEHGEIGYTPTTPGNLTLAVRLLDASQSALGTLTLTQDIAPLQADIEAAIAAAKDESGPGIGNPDVAREIANDHSPYHQDVTLQTPEGDDAFARFLFGVVYQGAVQRPPPVRQEQLLRIADALNGDGSGFKDAVLGGIGLCGIRLPLLAMTKTQLPWTELPQASAEHAAADEQLRASVAALDEDARIDLFNITRFPKSNIVATARIIEALRDRYFAGASFHDVTTGMSGTRAFWITRHFHEGPLAT